MSDEQIFEQFPSASRTFVRIQSDPEMAAFVGAVVAEWREAQVKAVATERERCAKIAEEDARLCGKSGELLHSAGVILMGTAAKIRSGE